MASNIHPAVKPATEPITVRAAASVDRGFTIPEPAADDKRKKEATTGFDLNIAAVQRKQDESAKVSALLSDIFEGDKDDSTGSDLQDQKLENPILSESEDSVLGLDALHTEFLRILAQQSSWSRDALEFKGITLKRDKKRLLRM